jgi:hypothetical protein
MLQYNIAIMDKSYEENEENANQLMQVNEIN